VGLSESEREKLVRPFLIWERATVDVKKAPSAKLVARFADDIRGLCSGYDDTDQDRYTAGVVADYLFEEYESD
jgi:hypothetical protein